MTTADHDAAKAGLSAEASRWIRERHYWVSYMYPSPCGTRTIHGDGSIPIREPISGALMQRMKDSIALDGHLPNGTFVVIVSMIELEEP